MSGPLRILEDGTRVYAGGMKYKPVPLEQRKNRIRKPDDPRAVRWYSEWIILPELVEDEQRILPETVPDSEAYEHWMKKRGCRCEVCRREGASKYKEKADRDREKRGTLQPESDRD